MERTSYIKRRRPGQRRTEHPFPLPSGEPVTAADVRVADPVEGPQWKLCHTTECAACFLARWVKAHSVTGAVDWSQLRPLPDGAPESHGHHEPTRGAGGTDKDTLPLCAHHHHVRHVVGVVAFWLYINYRAAIAEMRRRTALLTEASTTP